MYSIRYSLLIAAALAAVVRPLSAAEDQATANDQERQLIETLLSDVPPATKAITCKQLAIFGQRDAVAPLAALLTDPQLASWARIALEVIPDPAADEALRASLGSLQGRLLAGAINTIGMRRDAQAVAALAERLQNADPEVASAAAVALGRIGNPPAARALEQALTQAPAEVRSAVAEGCILCAEQRLAEGQSAEAIKFYDAVRQADVPRPRVLEATRGAILARQAAGVPLLVEQLRSADKAFLAIGLHTARELPGSAATEALVAELKQAPPDRQPLLILALGDRGDAAALPAVLAAAQGGADEVRVVALRVLKRLGDASYVPVLLEAAVSGNERVSQTALEVLVELPGQDVDQDLAGRLPVAQGTLRQVLIELAGRRRIAAALDALRKASGDPDPAIRGAAWTALGHTIELDDLSLLIAPVADPPATAAEAKAAEEALQIACERMPDREACTARLVTAQGSASVPARIKFLEILSVLGGSQALQAVGAAARDASPEIQDAGSRLLGEWMSVDAAPVLLDLARTASDPKYEIRALRGYIRLARQFTMPDEQRAEMCRAVLATAKRDAEKKLVLEVLERYPSIDTLRLAAEAAKVPGLKADAAATSLVIAQKIGGSSPAVQQLLSQIGQDPVKVEIVKALYGEGANVKDVTETLRQLTRDFPLVVLPSSSYNASFGGDPSPGVVKQLQVQYRINGQLGDASFPEDATILLPMPR